MTGKMSFSADARPHPGPLQKERESTSINMNTMEKVISFLKRLHPVSGALEAELENSFRYTMKKKNEFLLYEGQVCQYAWYLQKGLVRCYYTRGEHEVTTLFIEEDHMIVLHKSLYRKLKSIYNIQALEDCELYRIRFEDIQHVLETYVEAWHIRNIITNRYSNLKDIRIRATSIRSPNGRYAYFVRHFPQLLGRLTLEQIASYLNMSKSSVARARRHKF
jgi:CRP-like cAMP-binding protein